MTLLAIGTLALMLGRLWGAALAAAVIERIER